MDANTAKLIQDTAQGLSSRISQVWPVVGPLLGVFFGAYLTGRSQGRKWLADNKKEEYRELLTQLTHSFDEIRHYIPDEEAILNAEPDLEHRARLSKPIMVFADRIFIARDLEEMNTFEKWSTAVQKFLGGNDQKEFSRAVREIRREIIAKASRLRV